MKFVENPLRSKAQRRFLWATDPELARKFEDETPEGTKLPERKRKAVAKAARHGKRLWRQG
ncbi:MAG TPA: hypothetical protein VD932_02515 [Aquabacterium sp.]|nr:hypothetical protein [Aquabacterium sp.]